MNEDDLVKQEVEPKPTRSDKERQLTGLEWNAITPIAPEEGQIVETKIEDSKGTRNNALLVRRGNLWYFADESMYVYYTPTHWRKPLAKDLETELGKLSVTAGSLGRIRERVAATATRD